MAAPFLDKRYVALALIEAKYKIYKESFTTISELNQFILFMQHEFNERKLGIVITHELYSGDFNVNWGVITTTDRGNLDMNRLPDKILNILTDESLILEFFIEMETRRLEILKSLPKYPAQSSTDKEFNRVLIKPNYSI